MQFEDTVVLTSEDEVARLRAENQRFAAEINAVIESFGDRSVRVREGAGAENLCASLALSVMALQQDAAKWRALRDCPRITVMGTAGVESPKDNHYAHIAVNFWTVHDAQGSLWELEAFDKFVAIAQLAHAQSKA